MRTKTEYVEFKFSGVPGEAGMDVRLDSQVIPKKGSFKYLGSIIQGDGEIDEDVTHQCWPVKTSHTQKIKVVEIRMLRWMCGQTKLDKIKNEDIRVKVGVAPMEDKVRKARLRWFGHVKRTSLDAPARRSIGFSEAVIDVEAVIFNLFLDLFNLLADVPWWLPLPFDTLDY
ncbi:PREDICTED: uncharacterized protein LOC109217817 [Nicotiana attenuata]|uniref:uncharacterized protein LOC109217817 n=1 Tax=Nicotiana attenuata TaxID=49451 RepID=UPI000905641A|nr:PREDICTED: uncharacterized protein LOC109217817 [Nicotiana attenuata]